jgi:hypothetical protein
MKFLPIVLPFRRILYPDLEPLMDQRAYAELNTNICRNKWGASAVDALSTALVMEQKDIINQIIDYIPTINYYSTPSTVSLFETTIRYLGGMLSGYDFLSGPLASLAANKTNVDALLTQSQNLANALSYAFDTASGVPYNNLDAHQRWLQQRARHRRHPRP